MKSMNCISATGRRPRKLMPQAAPMMAVSAMGVSMTRSRPNFASRPSVTLNAPPYTPISSPMATTAGSRSISSNIACRIASTMVIGPEVARFWRTGSERCGTSSAPPLFILRIFGERLALGIFAERLLARAFAERFLLWIAGERFFLGRAGVGWFVLGILRTLAESFVFGAAAEGNARDGWILGSNARSQMFRLKFGTVGRGCGGGILHRRDRG